MLWNFLPPSAMFSARDKRTKVGTFKWNKTTVWNCFFSLRIYRDDSLYCRFCSSLLRLIEIRIERNLNFNHHHFNVVLLCIGQVDLLGEPLAFYIKFNYIAPFFCMALSELRWHFPWTQNHFVYSMVQFTPSLTLRKDGFFVLPLISHSNSIRNENGKVYGVLHSKKGSQTLYTLHW